MRNGHWMLVTGLGVVLLLVGLVALTVAQDRERNNREGNRERARVVWEYARLAVDGDLASFQAGENNLDLEVLGIEDLYRRLGGSFRPNVTNLLNQIGREGWELVVIDDGVWVFKRPQ
jgi:hypothetical protein